MCVIYRRKLSKMSLPVALRAFKQVSTVAYSVTVENYISKKFTALAPNFIQFFSHLNPKGNQQSIRCQSYKTFFLRHGCQKSQGVCPRKFFSGCCYILGLTVFYMSGAPYSTPLKGWVLGLAYKQQTSLKKLNELAFLKQCC